MFCVKATDKKMRGHNGFQFELGKVYHHTGSVVCCAHGFHCCDTLSVISRVCQDYGENGRTRYFIVKAWGRTDSSCSRFREKRAFEFMQLVSELKYKTLEEVKKSRAAITATFQGDQRARNLSDFDDIQAQFPSVLKKSVKKMRTRTVVFENVNRETIRKTAIAKIQLSRLCRYYNCPGILNKSQWKTMTPRRKFDIYHCDRVPATGLCLSAAKAYVQSLTELST